MGSLSLSVLCEWQGIELEALIINPSFMYNWAYNEKWEWFVYYVLQFWNVKTQPAAQWGAVLINSLNLIPELVPKIYLVLKQCIAVMHNGTN